MLPEDGSTCQLVQPDPLTPMSRIAIVYHAISAKYWTVFIGEPEDVESKG